MPMSWGLHEKKGEKVLGELLMDITDKGNVGAASTVGLLGEGTSARIGPVVYDMNARVGYLTLLLFESVRQGGGRSE